MTSTGTPVVILYDDATARRMEPFASTRPLGEVRSGALLVRERWERVLGVRVAAFAGGEWLDEFSEFEAPPSVNSIDTSTGPVVLVNCRALPHLTREADVATVFGKDGSVLRVAGRVAAIRVDAATIDRESLRNGSLTLDALGGANATDSAVDVDGVWLEAVWDHIGHLTTLLNADIPALAESLHCVNATALVTQIGNNPVWIEEGAVVEPFVTFDTQLGPILIRRKATIQSFTRIIGPCYVGEGTTVTTDRIANSSIGEMCRVHGELSSSIFLGHANKGHDGFVGHSMLGRWVNLGAGTITSNLKNTYGLVALWTPDGVRETNQQFLGTLFGDHVKTGIGLRLTTGCVVGFGANIVNAMPPKFVPPLSWGSAEHYSLHDSAKFIETAERMMSRRGVTLTDAQRRMWAGLHARATTAASAQRTGGDSTAAGNA